MTTWMKVLAGALLASMVAGAAQAQARERQQERLDELMPYAGEPLKSFKYWSLTQWELVGPQQLLVFPRVNEAFLLTVDAPCSELEWAQVIDLTSSAKRVNVRLDSVKVGPNRERCRINEIRSVDIKRYRAERKAAKAR